MYVCTLCMPDVHGVPEEDVGSLGTVVSGSSEIFCGCGELNPGPLE